MKAEAILTLRTNILLLRTAPPCLARYESFESRENRVRESELIKLVFNSHKLEKEISINVLDGVQPKPTSTCYLVWGCQNRGAKDTEWDCIHQGSTSPTHVGRHALQGADDRSKYQA